MDTTMDASISQMYIRKLTIKNFKCFKETFSLSLNPGVNIIVGDNEAGKSTILEAINLALTGLLNGKYLKNELSQYLFNKDIQKEYIAKLNNGNPIDPPDIVIEIFFDGDQNSALAMLQGTCNANNIDANGISFSVVFDNEYQSSYAELIKNNAESIKTIPIEYYKIVWMSFAGSTVVSRNIPIKSALIDSSSFRTQNGSDMYIAKIIRDNLSDKEKIDISQSHRNMRETFMNTVPIQMINSKLNDSYGNRNLAISVDLATQNAWENSLMTYLDDVPFHYIGKGSQNIIKTNIALSHKKMKEANILLIEEPENHLSYSNLNALLHNIVSKVDDKQVIISTHSSFVANKLGLDHLILINDLKSMRLNELREETRDFFVKLPGYNTLRLLLSNKAILVEGNCDELILQKAYYTLNKKLPIHDGIDVISVGNTFLRFLEIAEKINKNVVVVTDNDGKVESLKNKYNDYIDANKKSNIKICFNRTVHEYHGNIKNYNSNTLEPEMLRANCLEKMNQIFNQDFKLEDDMLEYMLDKKTECALMIFNTEIDLKFPEYIMEAIESDDNK